ncbi:MAG: LamG domain-containing protein, partial [Chitinophagaceae bacterium]
LGSDFLGRSTSAAEFDGYDDYFMAPESEKFNTDSVSLSCNVMVKSIDRRHTLINKLNPRNVTGFSYGLGQSQGYENKWSFAVPDKNEDCSTAATFQPSNAVYSTVTIEPGRWYNVISTFGTNGQKLYIDGKLVAETTRPFNSLKKCSGGNLLVGGWWQNDIISLDGKMDEVRVYNRVLNECEITELSKLFSANSGK